MNIGQEIKNKLRNLTGIVHAMLREVFDETAYERYLTRTCSERSKESYRSFLYERETVMARKPRCC